ncbi:MAG: hypothetical protein P8Y27_13205 [Chromatiaceae bacterium]
MGKAGPGSSSVSGVRGGRRYWVRDILSPETKGAKSRIKPPSDRQKRFVEPQRLTDAQRKALLSQLEAAKIGDADSRRLFAAALEYDLARLQELPLEQPPVPEMSEPRAAGPDETLQRLTEAAGALAERLSNLDEAARETLSAALTQADRFHRRYGKDYINTILDELVRIAAAAPRRRAAPRSRKPKAPPPPESARQFIQRVAAAFSDCFEARPTGDGEGAFATVLKAIINAPGVRIPNDPQVLEEVLAGRR